MKPLSCRPRKWSKLCHSKILQKSKQCYSQILSTFVFELSLASKQFSKMLPMTNFEFKWSWRLCIAFPESGFNFVTQTLAKKTRKCPCQRLATLAFELKVAPKPYSKIPPITKLNRFEEFTWLSKQMISKTCKKQVIFKPQQYLFLSSRKKVTKTNFQKAPCDQILI